MDAPARTMLTPGINSAFRKNLERQHNSGAQRIATGGEPQGKWDGQSVLFEVDGARMLEDPLLSEEVFRPTALLVRVKDVEQMIAIARQFRGQLSATMQIDPADHALAARLVPILERRTGRIVINAFSHPQEGVVRIDSWRTVPRNLRQSLHFSRHDGNRAISAASLLPGFPGRFATGSVEARQSVRHLASHRWRIVEGLSRAGNDACRRAARMLRGVARFVSLAMTS
ncbi:hypothetical protein [Paraburkholderia sp. LEh10]|uniref:hypothetical protein n=1 Tax=Paraburkholderia sp. LEh10 TaxID=2821353 RepID=UPI001FD7F2BE|nr:hypothetical protein [Paraburkholderia sp. LEh10]